MRWVDFQKLGSDMDRLKGSVEKTEMIEELGALKDNEARVEFRFDSDQVSFAPFTTADDFIPTRSNC